MPGQVVRPFGSTLSIPPARYLRARLDVVARWGLYQIYPALIRRLER